MKVTTPCVHLSSSFSSSSNSLPGWLPARSQRQFRDIFDDISHHILRSWSWRYSYALTHAPSPCFSNTNMHEVYTKRFCEVVLSYCMLFTGVLLWGFAYLWEGAYQCVCVWVCFWDSLCARNFWFDFQGQQSFTFFRKSIRLSINLSIYLSLLSPTSHFSYP